MKRLAILLALIATPALAQQQQQTPSQIALQLQQVVGNWALAIESLQKDNADLQSRLAAITKERDDLKTQNEQLRGK